MEARKRFRTTGLILLVICMLISMIGPGAVIADTRVMAQEDFENLTAGSYGPYVQKTLGVMSVKDDHTKYVALANEFNGGKLNKYGRATITNFNTSYGEIKQGGVPLAVFEIDMSSNVTDANVATVGISLVDENSVETTLAAAVIRKDKIDLPSTGIHYQGTQTPIVSQTGIGTAWSRIRVEIDTQTSKFRTTVLSAAGEQLGQSEWHDLNKGGTVYTLDKCKVTQFRVEPIHSSENLVYLDNILLTAGGGQPVEPGQKPVISNVKVNGTPAIGGTLSVVYDYQCYEDEDISKRKITWEASEDNGQSWNPIAGATEQSYTLVEGDLGKKIRAQVQAGSSYSGAPLSDVVVSDAVGPVAQASELTTFFTENFDSFNLSESSEIEKSFSEHLSYARGKLTFPVWSGSTTNKYASIEMTKANSWPRLVINNFEPVGSANVKEAVFEVAVGGNASGNLAQINLGFAGDNVPSAPICVAAVRNDTVTLPEKGIHFSDAQPVIARRTPGSWVRIRILVDTAKSQFKLTVLDMDGVSLGTSDWHDFNSKGTIYKLDDVTISYINVEHISSLNTCIFVDDVSVGAAFVPQPPVAKAVAVSGGTQPGEEVTASYQYVDVDDERSGEDHKGQTLFQWLRSDTADGTYTEIASATAERYSLTNDDIGKYLKVRVTPVSTQQPTTGEPVESAAYTGPMPPVASEVEISGKAVVDETLTAEYKYSDPNNDPEGTSTFRWLRADSAAGEYTAIADATAKTYTLTDADIGKYIKAEVTPVSSKLPYNGTPVQSDAFMGPCYPQAANVEIEGVMAQGQLLQAKYDYSDPNGFAQNDTKYRWYKSAAADGDYELIQETTSGTYRLTEGEKDCYIKLGVVPGKAEKPLSGTEVLSDAYGPVGETVSAQAPVAQDVKIAGNASVNELLTGLYTYYDINEDSEAGTTFRWLVGDTAEGDFTAIEGATEQFFAVSVDYLGKYIRFEVTPRADSDPKDGEPVQSEAVKVENLSRLFVATNGDNTNAGTIDSPLKTIEGARDKIREIKAAGELPKGGIVVYIRGGDYRLSSAIQFTAEDAGTEESPIMYRNYQDEKVIINGGYSLDNSKFEPVAPEIADRFPTEAAKKNVVQYDLKEHEGLDYGKIYVSGSAAPRWDDLPKGPPSPELYLNGEYMTLARYPNDILDPSSFTGISQIVKNSQNPVPQGGTGPAGPQIEGATFTYKDSRPSRWKSFEDIWLSGFFRWDWSSSTTAVKSFDVSKNQLTTESASYYGFATTGRYYYFNVLDELDVPGEWYLDRKNGMLYLYPTEEIRGSEITLSQMVDDMVKIENCSYLTIRGMEIGNGRGNGILIDENSHHILIDACHIFGLATRGVDIMGGHDNGVTNCEIQSIGAGGIFMKGGDKLTLTHCNNYAINNHIHNFGIRVRTYESGIDINGTGMHAAHNEIHNSPHIGIRLSGNDNLIEYNNLYDLDKETGDAGMIYAGRDWTYSGHVIRYNYLHDTQNPYPKSFGPFGIYIDDMASGFHVYGNIVKNVGDRSMHFGGGMNNLIENNVIIQGVHPIFFDIRGIWGGATWNNMVNRCYDALLAFPYDKEPWLTQHPELNNLVDAIENGTVKKGEAWNSYIRNNISYKNSKSNTAVSTDRGNKSIWPVIEDTNKKYSSDPGFENYNGGDYNLKADSRVFTDLPDFKPLPPMEMMGVIAVENNAPYVQDILILGSPTIGNLIKGTYQFRDKDGDLEVNTTYRWLWSDTLTGNYTPIDGATTDSLTIGENFAGKYVKFEVTPVDEQGAKGEPVLSEAINVVANKASLGELIDRVAAEQRKAVAGAALGQYPQSAINQLVQDLEAARTVFNNESATPTQIAEASTALGAAFDTFKSTQVTDVDINLPSGGEIEIIKGMREIKIDLGTIGGPVDLKVEGGILPATTITAIINGKTVTIQIPQDTVVGNTFTITPVATPSQEVFGEVYTALSLNGQYNTPIRILIAGAKGKTLLRNADGVQTEITNNMAQDRADAMNGQKTGFIDVADDLAVWTSETGEFVVADLYEKSSDPKLSGIYVNGTKVSGFDPEKEDYTHVLPADTTVIPEVTATSEHRASIEVKAADSVTGTATITSTSQDGTQTKTYRVRFKLKTSPTTAPDYNPPVPNYPTSGQGTSNGTSSGIGLLGNSNNTASRFTDTRNHWAKDDIETLAARGIVTGVTETTFEPDRSITRAEFATLIVKALNLTSSVPAGFADVAENAWHYTYVNAAANAGLITGYDGYFRPDDVITREEMAVIIAKAYVNLGGSASSGGIEKFTDKNEIADWAYPYVDTVTSAGLISGMTPSTFVGSANTTRAQAASVIKRLLD